MAREVQQIQAPHFLRAALPKALCWRFAKSPFPSGTLSDKACNDMDDKDVRYNAHSLKTTNDDIQRMIARRIYDYVDDKAIDVRIISFRRVKTPCQ